MVVLQDGGEAVSERGRIARRYQWPPYITDGFRYRSYIRSYDREPQCHGLEQRAAKPFATRGKRQDVSGTHEIWHVCPVPKQTDARCPLPGRFDVRADVSGAACDKKHRLRNPLTQQAEGRERRIDALLPVQPGRTQDHRHIVRDRERGSYFQAPVSSRGAKPR